MIIMNSKQACAEAQKYREMRLVFLPLLAIFSFLCFLSGHFWGINSAGFILSRGASVFFLGCLAAIRAAIIYYSRKAKKLKATGKEAVE